MKCLVAILLLCVGLFGVAAAHDSDDGDGEPPRAVSTTVTSTTSTTSTTSPAAVPVVPCEREYVPVYRVCRQRRNGALHCRPVYLVPIG